MVINLESDEEGAVEELDSSDEETMTLWTSIDTDCKSDE